MLAWIDIILVVRDDNAVHAKFNVGLNNDGSRRYTLQCVPHPIVVPIDVNRQQIYFARDASICNQVVDVRTSNHGTQELRTIRPGTSMFAVVCFTSLYALLVSINEQPGPTMIECQIGAVAVDPVNSAYVHEGPVGASDRRKKIQQQSIFLKLRIISKTNFTKRQVDACCESLLPGGNKIALGHLIDG
jgi:hypothetical protein